MPLKNWEVERVFHFHKSLSQGGKCFILVTVYLTYLFFVPKFLLQNSHTCPELSEGLVLLMSTSI